jgi:hypothetical protein
MGIINRDKNITEQVDNWDVQTTVVGVSIIIPLVNVPYTGNIQKVVMSAFGLSGSPQIQLQIQRFIVGTGNTIITLNGSSLLTAQAYSTSGLQTFVLPSLSSTLIQLQPNDQLQAVTSVANTAATYSFNSIIMCLQDFKTQYGLFVGI